MAKKIKTFGRPECRTVQALALAALEKAAADLGLKVAYTKGSFSPASFAATFTFSAVGDGGVPADFTMYCGLYGMKPEDYGRTFLNGGKTYKVVGLNVRKVRYPITAVEIATGKTVHFTKEGVVALLRSQDTKAAA